MAFSKEIGVLKIQIAKKMVTTCLTFPDTVTVKGEVFLVVMKLEKLRRKAIKPLTSNVPTM